MTIASESLQPKPALPFSGSFYSSVPTLQSVLEPKTPIFLIIRHSPGTLVALTYIPSNAGVRAKTLFAATRSTLARELGSEKFATTVFATEEEEIVTEQAWRERDLEGNGSPQAGYQREDLMDHKERELDAVRRAEEEARHGTAGRDVGTGGTLGRVSGYATGGSVDMPIPVDEDVKSSLRSIQDGQLVQLVSSVTGIVFSVYADFKYSLSTSVPKPSSLPVPTQVSLLVPWPPRYRIPRHDTASITIPDPMWSCLYTPVPQARVSKRKCSTRALDEWRSDWVN